MRIRALTYFLSISESDFTSETSETGSSSPLDGLFDDAKAALERASKSLCSVGYDVQTLRITLNPFETWLNTDEWGFDCESVDENGDTVALPGRNKSMLLAVEAQLTRIGINFCSLGGVSSDNAIRCIPDVLAMSPKFSCSASINSNKDDDAPYSIAVAPEMGKCLLAAQTCLDVAQRVGNLGNFRYAVGFDCDGRTPFFPCSSYDLPEDEVKDGDKDDNDTSNGNNSAEENMYAFNYTESANMYNNSSTGNKKKRPCGLSVGLENGDLLFLSNYGATDYGEATSNMKEVMKQCLLPIQKIMLEVCDSLNGQGSGDDDDSNVYLKDCTLDFFGIDASLNPGLELTESIGAGIENLLFLSTLPSGSTAGASPASVMQVQKGPEVYFGQFGTLSAVSSMTAALKSLQKEYNDGNATGTDSKNSAITSNGNDNTKAGSGEDSYSYASNIGLTAEEASLRDNALTALRLVGYCGLMLPVMEDAVLASRAAESPPTFTLRDLLAFSSICGVGLDTVPIAGDSNIQQIASVYLETGSLAYRLKKPLSCRLLPWAGVTAGQVVTVPPEMPYLIDTKAFSI